MKEKKENIIIKNIIKDGLYTLSNKDFNNQIIQAIQLKRVNTNRPFYNYSLLTLLLSAGFIIIGIELIVKALPEITSSININFNTDLIHLNFILLFIFVFFSYTFFSDMIEERINRNL